MFFVRNIKVLIGYLTSYIKESPFVSFRPHALLRFILDRCGREYILSTLMSFNGKLIIVESHRIRIKE